MDWLKSLLEAINLVLQEGAALSLLLGYVVAIGGTQYVKRLEAVNLQKWAIRALALPLGFVATFSTWPIPGVSGVRVFVALAVGLSSPGVYSIVTRCLYKRWPHLEEKLSAQPVEPKEPSHE